MWRNHGDVFQGEKKDDLLCARGTSIAQGWAVVIVPGLRILERETCSHMEPTDTCVSFSGTRTHHTEVKK